MNLGLDLIGEAEVTDILAPTNERASIAARQYKANRDAMLRESIWLFAREWVSLATNAAATLDPIRPYSHDLPTRCVRVIRPADATWVINGRQIFTEDSGALVLQIIRNNVPVPEMDALFVDALAARVVLRMVEKRTQSANKQQILRQHYMDAMAKARIANAVEEPARTQFGDHAAGYLAGAHGIGPT